MNVVVCPHPQLIVLLLSPLLYYPATSQPASQWALDKCPLVSSHSQPRSRSHPVIALYCLVANNNPPDDDAAAAGVVVVTPNDRPSAFQQP